MGNERRARRSCGPMNAWWLVLAVAPAAVVALGRLRMDAWAGRSLTGHATVADRVRQYGPAAEARLQATFARAGAAYPPARAVLVGLKAEKQLRVLVPAGDAW